MKKLKKAMAMGLTALSMSSGVKMGATSIPMTQTSYTNSISDSKNESKQEVSKKKTGKGALITQTIGTVGLVASMIGTGIATKKLSESGFIAGGVGVLASAALLMGSNIGNIYNYVKGWAL